MNNIIFKTLLLKGEAGNDIQSVEKTATSGLVDTYTITLTDGSTYTFNVTNGKSIVSIEKTSSVGYVDTYTITYNDGSTDTFEITLATITVDDALSDSSTNPVENRVVTDALNTKSNNSNLATVESGTTASQAYTVGDYLVYNGQLCKVTSAIAQGDTLTVGTNIEVTTSGGEFKKINSDLTELRLSVRTKTQTYPITSTSQSAGYYYQHLSVPSEIVSINKICGCVLISNVGVGTVVSMIVDVSSNYIEVRYTQAPNNGKITLRFLYDAN